MCVVVLRLLRMCCKHWETTCTPHKIIYDAKTVLTDYSIIPNHNLSKGASFGLLTEREFSTHQTALKFALIKYNSNEYQAKYVLKAFIF